jgi:hypothetical protein
MILLCSRMFWTTWSLFQCSFISRVCVSIVYMLNVFCYVMWYSPVWCSYKIVFGSSCQYLLFYFNAFCLCQILCVKYFYLHIVGFFLVKETRVPGKNQRPVSSHWQTLSHNIVLGTPCHERDSNSSSSRYRHWLQR